MGRFKLPVSKLFYGVHVMYINLSSIVLSLKKIPDLIKQISFLTQIMEFIILYFITTFGSIPCYALGAQITPHPYFSFFLILDPNGSSKPAGL